MSGTKALSELDSWLNERYNEYMEEAEYESATIITIVRDKLDELYTQYLTKGD